MADRMTPQDLREHFHYDAASGVFTRLKAQHRSLIGKPAARLGSRGYLVLFYKAHPYLAHRCAVAWMTGKWPEADVDHQNGDPCDNRWDNLRVVASSTNSENQRRAHRDSATGILGVSRHGRAGFRAQIKVDGKNRHLGTFPTAEEASAAYLRAKRELHAGCTL